MTTFEILHYTGVFCESCRVSLDIFDVICSGYIGDAEATASTLDKEGWLKTGDLCYIDQDGFVFVVDRLKELIKYKAYQVLKTRFCKFYCSVTSFYLILYVLSRYPQLNWSIFFIPILKLLMLL